MLSESLGAKEHAHKTMSYLNKTKQVYMGRKGQQCNEEERRGFFASRSHKQDNLRKREGRNKR